MVLSRIKHPIIWGVRGTSVEPVLTWSRGKRNGELRKSLGAASALIFSACSKFARERRQGRCMGRDRPCQLAFSDNFHTTSKGRSLRFFSTFLCSFPRALSLSHRDAIARPGIAAEVEARRRSGAFHARS